MSPSGRSRGRRDAPGHNHRLTQRRVPGASAMAAATNDYLSAIAAEGFSPYTVAYRTRSLGVLVVWLAERGISSPGEVTKPVLERYQRSLFHHRKTNGDPLSFRTQAAYLVPVKALFKWLARTNRILYNPASELVMPRIERRLPRTVLSISEAEVVLAQADLSEPIGVRDRAIMEVAYSTGLRRSELRALQLVDVDHDRGWVAVRQGKGAKDRAVPIGDRALAWVDRYLIDVRPRLVVPPDDGVLFLTLDGNDLTPDYLSDKIGRYIRAGTGKPGSCHTFRHTMATLMLEGGADIRHIQEILGHAQLSTTEIYTHVNPAALKHVHTTCHPAAANHRRHPAALGATERSEGASTTPPPTDPAETLAEVLDAEAAAEAAGIDTPDDSPAGGGLGGAA